MYKFKKILNICIILCFTFSTYIFANNNKINIFGIYNAYPNLNNLNLYDFSDACIEYYGLNNITPSKNIYKDISNNDKNILRLIAMDCITIYDDKTIKPNEIVGKEKADLIISKISKNLNNTTNNNSKFQFLSTDVKPEMTNPDYWITKNPDAYKILLDSKQIKKLNDDFLKIPENHLVNLEKVPEKFDANEIIEKLLSFEITKDLYIDGKIIDKSFWDDVKKTIQNSIAPKDSKIKYAIVTDRTCLKQFPIKEMLSDSLDDVSWDEPSLSSMNVNEPLLVFMQTPDNEFSYVYSTVYDGWIKNDSIAICKNKDEWLKMWKPEKFIIVTGDKIFLETNIIMPEVSKKMLSMSTCLPLVTNYDEKELIINRIPYNNYLVKFPLRDSDGKLYTKTVPISANEDINVGYLDFTRSNMINLAFKHLGNNYGWGGILDAYDCSEFPMRIYKCFGITFPRNTISQRLINKEAITQFTEDTTTEEKIDFIKTLKSGTLLQFPGHEMIYLGEENGKLYTINSLSSIKKNDTKKRIRSTVINTLDTTRMNDHKWIEDIDCIIDITKIN